MKKRYLVAALCCVASVSMAKGHKGKKHGDYKSPGWGMAGCGLGATIIKDNSLGPQLGAWFLNSISGNQTSGMTTGTSNCRAKGHHAVLKQEQEVFVSVNRHQLERDVAQGGGQHSAALADILGCGGQLDRFNDLTRSNYDSLFQGEEADRILGRLGDLINNDPVLGKECSRVVYTS